MTMEQTNRSIFHTPAPGGARPRAASTSIQRYVPSGRQLRRVFELLAIGSPRGGRSSSPIPPTEFKKFETLKLFIVLCRFAYRQLTLLGIKCSGRDTNRPY